MARPRGHGGGKLRAAGLPRRVSARSRRHRDLCGASGAAPPRHGLGSRPPRPRRPEWAGGTGTRFPRGAGSACGRAGTPERPPHPAREPPDLAVSGSGAASPPPRHRVACRQRALRSQRPSIQAGRVAGSWAPGAPPSHAFAAAGWRIQPQSHPWGEDGRPKLAQLPCLPVGAQWSSGTQTPSCFSKMGQLS